MITAAEEFKKNPELMEEHLENIREWLSKQPHLPQNVSDELIILIMHSCNYHMEECKNTIDQYFTLRTHLPEFFTNRNFHNEDIQQVMQTCNVLLLKGRTKEGYKLVMVSFQITDPNYFNFPDLFKLIHMIADAIFLKKGTMPGFIILVDFGSVKMGHITRLAVPEVKKAITYLQDGFPVRLKGTHYFNTGPYFEKFVSLIKPFMKKKLFDILYVHQEGSDSLYKYVPKEMFPTEYGGSGGIIKDLRDMTYGIVMEFLDWYKEDEKLRVDESKRVGKAKSAGLLFGAVGSFKRLSIDMID